MEIGIDIDNWQVAAAAGEINGARPDWQGLRARMAAASAVQAMLADAAVHASRETGSFDPRSAEAIGAFWHDLGGVNLSPLSNGRDVCGNNEGMTGSSAAGGRGK